MCLVPTASTSALNVTNALELITSQEIRYTQMHIHEPDTPPSHPIQLFLPPWTIQPIPASNAKAPLMDKEPVQRPSTTSASTKRHALSSPQTEDGDVSRKRQCLDIPDLLHHVRKPDIQQSLPMVINFINHKLESQERRFNHKLAEQETRWQTRFENLESKWVGELASAELELERSKTRVMSIEMDLRERVGRLEGALAVLLRQSQGMPMSMPMGNLSATDYHAGRGNPGALAPNGVATRGDLEQTLMPIWSREQAIDDLYEQQVVKIQRPDSVVGDQIVVERQHASLSMGADDEVDTALSGSEHDHPNSYFQYVPLVLSPLFI